MSESHHAASDRRCREAVAYDLMRDILFDDPCRPEAGSPDFRGYLLDLYVECLAAVRGRRIKPTAQTRAPDGDGVLRARMVVPQPEESVAA
jgi:hypothetical protein